MTIFEQALDREVADRATFVAGACGEDTALRREVEALLAADADASGFLERTPTSVVRAAAVVRGGGRGAAPHFPARFGKYRLLGVLGEGGMGTVYDAEQEHPHRRVALKTVRSEYAAEEIRQRFARESEALGRMQHPGIAQIYEAGTADGPLGPQPYFAMELVDGRPLTAYAATLPTARERVALVAAVCDAVHYAHQRGVIHRDLKPANVLVDGAGRPKVLDFGVARLTDADVHGTRATSAGEVIGTLQYMSPEQFGGDALDVDVRCDVYALGVILYEVLAGRRPYELAGRPFLDAMRVVASQPVPSLGTVDRALRGDLEVVVSTALEKEPSRRYQSAAALAADLHHVLREEPITARPATAAYQLRTFARRNRALVAGAGLAAAALVAGAGVSTWQALRARAAERAAEARRVEATAARAQAEARGAEAIAARDLAERRRLSADTSRDLAERARVAAEASAERARQEKAKAQSVNDFLRQMLASANPYVAAGRTLTVRDVLGDAARRLDARAVGREPEVEGALRLTLGESYLQLGVPDSAAAQFDSAIVMLGRAGSRAARTTLAGVLDARARVQRQRGDLAGAGRLYARGLAVADRATPANAGTLAALRTGLSFVRYSEGRNDDAVAEGRRALSLARAADPRLPESRRVVVQAKKNLADMLTYSDRHDEAVALWDEVLTTLRHSVTPPDAVLADALMNSAYSLSFVGRLTEANAQARDALAQMRVLYTEDPTKAADALSRLGDILIAQDSLAAAEPALREALAIREKALGGAHVDVQYARASLGELLTKRARWAEAESLLTLSLAGRRTLFGDRHPAVASTMEDLLDVAVGRGDQARAESLALGAADRWRAAGIGGRELGAVTMAARAALALRRPAVADSLLADVLARQPATERSLKLVDALEVLADAAEVRARPDDAERALLRAETALRGQTSEATARRHAALVTRLVAFYERAGRDGDAAAWRARRP